VLDLATSADIEAFLERVSDGHRAFGSRRSGPGIARVHLRADQ
jgi:hypothetical protein